MSCRQLISYVPQIKCHIRRSLPDFNTLKPKLVVLVSHIPLTPSSLLPAPRSYASGSVIVNVLPLLISLSTVILPPCNRTTSCDSARPKPVPVCSCTRGSLLR